MIELCEVHSFATSSNLCQCTTVLNAKKLVEIWRISYKNNFAGLFWDTVYLEPTLTAAI